MILRGPGVNGVVAEPLSGLVSGKDGLVAPRAAGKERVEFQPAEVEPAFEGDFVLDGNLQLECGRALERATLHYAMYGRLNDARDNAVLVCHALSGSALVGGWWPGLFVGGSGRREEDSAERDRAVSGEEADSAGIMDLERDCLICVNLLGSCYGSTGPGSVNPESGLVYGPEFPVISIGDNVRAQARLMDALGIRKIGLAIGGSIGGMQVLEWAILFPDRVGKAVVIAVAPLGAMGLAMNHLQRRAIMSDPDWREGRYLPQQQPRRGLALARQTAMLSYKSGHLFEERFGRNPNRSGEDPWALDGNGGGLEGGRFDVAGFLDYQGERFVERFDANSYLAILRTMDLWDPTHAYSREIGGVKEGVEEAFARIQAHVIFVGISSDWLFPAEDVRRLADWVGGSGARVEYREMVTQHGHDAFLAEQGELLRLLRPLLGL